MYTCFYNKEYCTKSPADCVKSVYVDRPLDVKEFQQTALTIWSPYVSCSVVMTEIKNLGATLRLRSRNFKFHYEPEDSDIGFEVCPL